MLSDVKLRWREDEDHSKEVALEIDGEFKIAWHDNDAVVMRKPSMFNGNPDQRYLAEGVVLQMLHEAYRAGREKGEQQLTAVRQLLNAP
jgi:23S rRNA-/tRNA-specific pseudouridylate synthase